MNERRSVETRTLAFLVVASQFLKHVQIWAIRGILLAVWRSDEKKNYQRRGGGAEFRPSEKIMKETISSVILSSGKNQKDTESDSFSNFHTRQWNFQIWLTQKTSVFFDWYIHQRNR